MLKTKYLFLGLILFSQNTFAEILLFVDDDCGHCNRVERYLNENNIEIDTYEISNPENLKLYVEKAKELNYRGGAVPLLIDDNKYIEGADPIIEHLAKEPEETTPTFLTSEDSQKINEIISKNIENPGQLTEAKSNYVYPIAGILTLMLALSGYKKLIS